jgi:lipid-A-disaccharide synthase-like uncharacterized protein
MNFDFNYWQIIGIIGLLLFSSRWAIQVIASYKNKKSIVPQSFWIISLMGSFLLLIYFIFSSRDLIGILANLFPLLIAVYNIYLNKKNRHINDD